MKIIGKILAVLATSLVIIGPAPVWAAPEIETYQTGRAIISNGDFYVDPQLGELPISHDVVSGYASVNIQPAITLSSSVGFTTTAGIDRDFTALSFLRYSSSIYAPNISAANALVQRISANTHLSTVSGLMSASATGLAYAVSTVRTSQIYVVGAPISPFDPGISTLPNGVLQQPSGVASASSSSTGLTPFRLNMYYKQESELFDGGDPLRFWSGVYLETYAQLPPGFIYQLYNEQGIPIPASRGTAYIDPQIVLDLGDLDARMYELSVGGGLVSNLLPNNTAPVPEPATWAMMILGFGFIGAAMRRRQAVHVSFV